MKREDLTPGQPAVCSVHKAVAAGNPNNGGIPLPRKVLTPEQHLDELMRSRDENTRLRAVDIFLKRLERQTACPSCQATRERDRERISATRRLTFEQRSNVKELIQTVNDILELARTQPLTWDEERMQYTDQPAPEPIAVPVVIAAPPVFEEPDDEEEDEEIEADDRDPLTVPPED